MRDAATIDYVIDHLTTIIATAKSRRSRLGYFPALYRRVTIEVKDRIAAGFFDDGDRMEHLDVIFANRYLDALDRYEAGERPAAVWRYAFDVTNQWWPIVLQHLLLGMHAHINLDLGIAAIQTGGPSELPGLRRDFNRINHVLADLVAEVRHTLTQIWPTLRIVGPALGGVDATLINFRMEKARDAAWALAQQLATLKENARQVTIQNRDAEMLKIAHRVLYPGVLLGLVTKVVRSEEVADVPTIIGLLE